MVPATVGHQCPECVREGRKLQPAVKAATGTPYGTYAIIAVCVVMLVVTAGGTDSYTLYRHGAAFGPAVAAGEWWRLLTPIFLHNGFLHIAFNMFALYLYGQGLERVLGTTRFVALFLAAGFFGNALSMSVNHARIGVGASGGVFGVLGAWAVYFWRRRRTSLHADQMLRGILGLIGVNLFLGFVLPGIDMWAHVGGMVGGAAVGFASDDAVGHRSKTATLWWSVGGLALVVGVGLVLVVTEVLSGPACRLVDVGRVLRCV